MNVLINVLIGYAAGVICFALFFVIGLNASWWAEGRTMPAEQKAKLWFWAGSMAFLWPLMIVATVAKIIIEQRSK